jgi:hypothetical protein
MKQVIDTRTLSEKVLGVPPSEEVLYHEHFQKAIWSLEDFCALMGGLSPQKYKEIIEKKFEYPATPSDFRCLEDAQKIQRKFIKHFGEIFLTDKIHIANGHCYMTPWKFVKWLAMNNIPIKDRFLDALPLYLVEIYLEFQLINFPLRARSSRSRVYHETLYLKNAREISQTSPRRLSRKEIYSHPRMQEVLRQIRNLGGHYNERTITDVWLAKLENCPRGRPKKC